MDYISIYKYCNSISSRVKTICLSIVFSLLSGFWTSTFSSPPISSWIIYLVLKAEFAHTAHSFFCLDHPILILLWTIVHCTIRQGEINCDWRRRRCGLCSQFVAVVSLIVWEKQKENWIDEKPRICVFIRNFVSFAFDSNNFILCGLFVFLCPLTNVIY